MNRLEKYYITTIKQSTAKLNAYTAGYCLSAHERHGLLAIRQFVQEPIQITPKKTSKLHTIGLLWGDSISDRWILLT